MTKRYFVRYFVETSNAVSNRREIENGKFFNWKFNLGNTEIVLYDDKQGLRADFYIDAEFLEKGEEKSKIFIENILNLIDFSTSSASSMPLFISIYDASLGLVERKYKKVLMNLFQKEILVLLIKICLVISLMLLTKIMMNE